MSKFIVTNDHNEANVNDIVMPQKDRKLVQSHVVKSYGNAQWKCFNTGSGIAYCHYENVYHEDVQIEGTTQNDYSFLAFNVGSSIHMETLPHNQEITLNPNVCFSGSIVKGHKSYGAYAKDEKYSKHFIIMENQLFKKLFSDHMPRSPLPSVSNYSTDSFSIHYANQINQQQRHILKQISDAPQLFQGALQEIYLESKILELVYGFFPATSQRVDAADYKTLNLSHDDIKSLEKAKQILVSDLTNPPSLKTLAHLCALNEFKLKKGFKQLFGTTVYGLLHEYRLESAKDLLLNNEISIQEAANQVGYTSLGHFSKIFRQKYGTFPLQMKKKRFFS